MEVHRPLEMYCIQTFTANRRRSQAKVKVSATLHGADTFCSEMLPLVTNTGKSKAVFNKGSVDTFYMVASDIPDLNKITLYCEGANRATWLLTYVLVKVNGKTYKAVFNKWMAEREEQAFALIEDHRVPYQGGFIQLGPMLKFRGNFENRFWRVSAMIATHNVQYMNGQLSFWKSIVERGRAAFNSSHEIPISYSQPPVMVYQQNNFQLWRFDFDVELNTHREQMCYYKLPQDPRVFSFRVPALNQKPGILFCSCNDRAHPYNMTFGENAHKSVGWMYMEQGMGRPETPYHLLILGGDQIYADPLFGGCESVRLWENLPNKKEKWNNSAAYFTPKTVEELNVFYFKMYIFCWEYEATQRVMSAVPSVMMYDDHDIFDGWGSLNPTMNDSFMLMSIFQVAKKHFFLFQMQGDLSSVINDHIMDTDPITARRIKPLPAVPTFGWPENLADQGPFNVGLSLTGGVNVILYDLRTERRMFTHNDGIIMTENSFRNIERFLKTKSRQSFPQHIYAVLTVPIHYPDADLFNKLLDVTNHNLIDDVRDHYSATIHKQERARILQHLGNFCVTAYAGSRATILSGDVHVGGYSLSNYKPKNSDIFYPIEQFISSGIAAKPPPKFALKIMGTPLFRNKDKLVTETAVITQEMKHLPNNKKWLSTSNFLRLNPVNDSYSAEWVGCPPLRPDQVSDPRLTTPLDPPIVLQKLLM